MVKTQSNLVGPRRWASYHRYDGFIIYTPFNLRQTFISQLRCCFWSQQLLFYSDILYFTNQSKTYFQHVATACDRVTLSFSNSSSLAIPRFCLSAPEHYCKP